jgi:hypothetical protein
MRAALLSLLLVGCHWLPVREVEVERRVEVKVPVAVMPTPPAVLLEVPAPPRALFVSPSDPAATSALTPDGELRLRAWVEDLQLRLDAWAAWASGETTAESPETLAPAE